MDRMRRVADGLIGLSATIGAIGLIFVMGVILIHVIGRALKMPLYGSEDLITMSMIIIVFGAMALCDRIGGHIAVDLLENRFPPVMNRALDVIAAFTGAVIFIALAIAVYQSSKLSILLNHSTNLLQLPKHWFQYALIAFSLVTALGMILRGLDRMLGIDARPPQGTGK